MRLRIGIDPPSRYEHSRYEVQVERDGDGNWWTDEISHSNLDRARTHEAALCTAYPDRPVRIVRTDRTEVFTVVGAEEQLDEHAAGRR